VRETVTFFETLGVSLHEEADGKLFPDSGRARDVLDALLGTLADSGAHLVAGCRVTSLARAEPGFVLDTGTGPMRARAVVLATGGLSLPKSGSDGAGYGFARALGHTLVPTTPALVPLVLAGESRTLATTLTGVAEPVRLAVRVDGRQRTSIAGALLWTHFGISGPAVLDASRHWLRARLEGTTPTLSANLLPGQTFESAEAAWTEAARGHGRTLVRTHLARDVPGSVAAALAERLGVPADLPLARLARTDRRALLHGLLDLPLDVSDSRGYRHAEVTAGGIALDEFDSGTLESRRCPGLYAVGEVLDVDGRLGGFNFQWAWSSARVAADALARRLA
jgi:hypothetical protein